MASVAQRVAAAVRGATKSGFEPDRIEVTPEGRIILSRGGAVTPTKDSDLDKELAAWRSRTNETSR